MDLSNLPEPTSVEPIPTSVTPDQAGIDREDAFRELSNMSLSEVIGNDGLSPLGIQQRKAEQEQRQRQLEEERLGSISDVIKDIATSQSISPEARSRTITRLTNDVLAGTHPEEIAREEILNQEIEYINSINDQVTQSRVVAAQQDSREVTEALAQATEELKRATDPTIPYLETGVEFVTSEILGFLRSSGYSINEMIEEGMGINAFELNPSASSAMKRAFDKAQTMSPAERVVAIKKMKEYALRHSGILLDNGWEADSLSAAIQSIFGSAFQNRAAADQNFWMQWFGVVTAGTTTNLVNKGVKAVKGTTKAPGPQDLPDFDDIIDDGSTGLEGEFIPGTATKQAPKKPRKGTTVDSTATDITNQRVLRGPQGEPKTGIPAGTPAQVVSETAPNAAREVMEEALTDPAFAKKLGTNPEQVAEEVIMFKAGNEARRRSPNILFRSIEDGIDPELRQARNNPDLPSSQEVNDLFDELVDRFDPNDQSIRIHQSQMDTTDPTSLNINYAIGNESGIGFGTKEEALDFAREKLSDADTDAIEILGYNAKTNRYEPDIDGPEYLIQARYRKRFADAAQAESVFRGKFDSLTNHLETTVRYAKRIADAITRIDLTSGNVNTRLTEILKPLSDVKDINTLNEVWRVLKHEEANEKVYSKAHIDHIFRDHPKGKEGYYAVRNFYKQVWALRNQMYRDHLQRSQYRSFKSKDGEEMFARPLRDTDEVHTVWWDDQSRMATMEELNQKGIKVDILQSHLHKATKDEATPYIAVPQGKNVLDPLPANVLREQPGYLGRNLNAKYVVYKKQKKKINGTLEDWTHGVVRVANNPADAEKFRGGNETLGVRQSREVTDYGTDQFTGGIDSEIRNLADLGLMTHTRHKAPLSKLDVSHIKSLDSPEQTLYQVKQHLQRTVGLEQFIDYSTKKWMKTYGKATKVKQFPWNGEFAKTGDIRTQQTIRAAEIYRDKIKLVAGMDDASIDQGLQSRMLGFAEDLAIASVNPLKRGWRSEALAVSSKAVAGLSGIKPIQRTKQAGHIMYIALNTSRQLIMQSGSAFIYAGVPHGSAYFATGMSTADAMTMAALKMTQGVNSTAFENIIKTSGALPGRSADDLRAMYIDLEKSGILSSVSSHQFMEHAMQNATEYRLHAGRYAGDQAPNGVTNAGHTIKAAGAGYVNLSSKYGFEMGEKVNRMYAFLAIRNKHIQEGTYSRMDPLQLGVEASQLAQNMGSANKAAFQTGNLSPLFQFQSHGIKMMQFMLPNSKLTKEFAIPTISNKTKRNMLIWNTVAFGTGGVGLANQTRNFWDDYIAEISEEGEVEPDSIAEQIASYGVTNLLLKSAIENLTDSELRTTFAGTVSPLGSIFSDAALTGIGNFDDGGRASNPITMMGTIGWKALTGQQTDPRDLMGVPGGIIKTGVKTWDNVTNIVGFPGFKEGPEGFSDAERMQESMLALAQIVPQFNNLVQARMMANTGKYIDRYGNPVVQATVADAWMKAIVGENPDDINKLFELRAKWQGKFAGVPPTDNELKQTGRDIATQIITMTRRKFNGELNREQLIRSTEDTVALLKTTYEDDPQAVRAVWAHVNKALERAIENDGKTAMVRFLEEITDDQDLYVSQGLDGILSELNALKTPKARLLVRELEKIKNNTE